MAKLTNKIILALSCLIICACSQNRNEPPSAESAEGKGVYANYDFYTDAVNEPVPEGYTPFYITHYGRHGARHINREWEYDAVAKVLGEASLTQFGQQIKAEFDRIYPHVKGRATDLTLLGREQQRHLAIRMYEAWPEVFCNDCHVEAVSSDIPRCVLSMNEFLSSLKDCQSTISVLGDVNSAIVPVLKKKPLVRIDTDAKFYECFDADALYGRLFTDVTAAKSLYAVPDFVRSLFYFGVHLECVGFDDKVMRSAFTDEEASLMADLDDYKFSHHCGWGNPVNVASSWTLLEHFVMMADKDIDTGSTDVRLRFGHDNTLVPMMALTKVGPFAEESIDCDNIPMASNLRWIFARNKAGDVIMKVQYNESDMSPWTPWAQYRDFCLGQIEWAKNKLAK